MCFLLYSCKVIAVHSIVVVNVSYSCLCFFSIDLRFEPGY